MIFKNTKIAFTLIELLVVIAIISILVLGVNSLDFNRLNGKQKLEIFTNSIKANYETIRNNALAGKGIGTNLIVPKKWKIDFSKSSSGKIITSYSNDGINWINYNNTDFQNLYKISSIRCLEIDGTLDNSLNTGTGTIDISGINTTLGGDCSNNKSKILEINFINKKNEIKKLEINTLNGLVNTK